MIKLLEKLGLKKTTVKKPTPTEDTSARQTLASQIMWGWPDGEPIRVERALELFPELADCDRALLEIAVEEFADRRNSPDDVTATSFADQFPAFRTELLDALVVDQFLSQADWFDEVLTKHKPEDLQWPALDEEVAGFRLLENLGHGGFSRVFLAEDLNYPQPRKVAVKFCSNETHEVSALANLNHGAIGVVHSVQRLDDRQLSVICMPFKTRSTLHRVIRKTWIDGRPSQTYRVWDEIRHANKLETAKTPEWAKQSFNNWVVDLAAELARGLVASHEMETIHCDIKPSNILVDKDGRPTLVDFNVAFQKDASASPGNVGGTLPYMAPEQIRAFAGQGYSDVGAATDIYGFGATMYELLTGRPPFGPAPTADDGIRILLEQRKVKPQPIRKYNPAVDPDLERLIMACLNYEMTARPVSAQVIADELDFISKRNLVQTMPNEWWRLRKNVVGIAAISLMIAVAVAPFLNEAGDASDKNIDDNNIDLLALQHDDSTPVVSDNPITPQEHAMVAFDRGYTALENGKFEQAVKLFEKGTKLDSTHDGGRLGYIRALTANRNYQSAKAELNMLFREHPIAELEAFRGHLNAVIDRHDDAIKSYERAMARGFKSPQLMSNYAFSLSLIAKNPMEHRKALQMVRQAIQQFNNGTVANRVLILATFRSDSTGQSWIYNHLIKAAQAIPDRKTSLMELAFINYTFGVRAGHLNDGASRESLHAEAVDQLVEASKLGMPDDYFAMIRPLLSETQTRRVTEKGWFPNAGNALLHRPDPASCLFDPISGTLFERCLHRDLRDVKTPAVAEAGKAEKQVAAAR